MRKRYLKLATAVYLKNKPLTVDSIQFRTISCETSQIITSGKEARGRKLAYTEGKQSTILTATILKFQQQQNVEQSKFTSLDS